MKPPTKTTETPTPTPTAPSVRERFLQLKQQLNAIPLEIAKLESQKRDCETELKQLLRERLLECAEPWDGTQTVSGHPVYVDLKHHNMVLQTGEKEFVLISVQHLKFVGADAASELERAFTQAKKPMSSQKFPLTGNNSTGIFSCDAIGLWKYFPAASPTFSKPETTTTTSTESKGHVAYDSSGKELHW